MNYVLIIENFNYFTNKFWWRKFIFIINYLTICTYEAHTINTILIQYTLKCQNYKIRGYFYIYIYIYKHGVKFSLVHSRPRVYNVYAE